MRQMIVRAAALLALAGCATGMGDFNHLTSGNLDVMDSGSGEVDQAFQVNAGTRYLVIAYPSSGGVVDAAHAHYLDVVP